MRLLNFSEFVNESMVNEAQIKDKAIVAKLERIHEIKEKLKTLTAETKAIEGELKEFDASIKPIFDAMKVLNDKLATTEKYVLKITRYGGEGTAVAYGKAVEQALVMVDEAAQAIINECVRQHTSVTQVKHSFEINKLDEGKLSDKAKAAIAKISDKIKSIVEKFKGFFAKKIERIDAANAKLAALVK